MKLHPTDTSRNHFLYKILEKKMGGWASGWVGVFVCVRVCVCVCFSTDTRRNYFLQVIPSQVSRELTVGICILHSARGSIGRNSQQSARDSIDTGRDYFLQLNESHADFENFCS